MVGRFCLSVTLILPLRASAVKRQSKAVTGVAALAKASLQGARSMVRWLYITLEGGIPVRVGEVCLLTENVERLSDFYIRLLGLGDAGNDPVHRTLMAGETALTVYREPGYRACGGQSIVLAFTVADVDAAVRAWNRRKPPKRKVRRSRCSAAAAQNAMRWKLRQGPRWNSSA